VTSDALRREIEELLVRLCAEHGIAPVPKLEWSKRMRHLLGRAFLRENVIRLSAWLGDEQAAGTLRHELAHIAVRGGRRRRPHGPHWQEWAERLGVEPRATARAAPANAPARSGASLQWALECPGCGLRLVRQRVLRGLYHRDCGPRRGKLVRVDRMPRDAALAWAAEAK
jgi:predicted SprT family Zn-dependent metalloprotease